MPARGFIGRRSRFDSLFSRLGVESRIRERNRGPRGAVVGSMEEPRGTVRAGARASQPPAPTPERSSLELEGLLAGVLGAGAAGGRERARHLLAVTDLSVLARLGAPELRGLAGLTAAQAQRLAAAFDLGRAVERARLPARPRLTRPAEVHRLLAPELRGLEKETFHVLLLDARHRLKGRARVSEGTLSTSLVHPREVFAPALRQGAAALIVAHNHPSGDPEPSAEDLAVTRRLREVGRLVGVPLLDHVVIGDGAWASLAERLGET